MTPVCISFYIDWFCLCLGIKVAEILSQYTSEFSKSLNDTFDWFDKVLFRKVQERFKEFTFSDLHFKFISVSEKDNVFFTGEEYFVTKIRVDKKRDIFIRLSSVLMDTILTNALGEGSQEFVPDNMTELEAKILTGLNDFIYKGLNELLVLRDLEEFDNPNTAHFTFVSKNKNGQVGKMVVSIPVSILPDTVPLAKQQSFDMGSFPKYKVEVNIMTGASVLSLFDVRHIEAGDIVVLEQSNIKTMKIDIFGNKKDFAINPDTSIILGIDNSGGKEDMTPNTNGESGMWDAIPVDIVAEFENVTITLGELKQISEGTTVDLASIYENKIYLKVENKKIASGELVIINDKYAVRVDEVYGEKPKTIPQSQPVQQPVPPQQVPPQAQQPAPQQAPQPQQVQQQGNEDFNYNDFDIEDEDI